MVALNVEKTTSRGGQSGSKDFPSEPVLQSEPAEGLIGFNELIKGIDEHIESYSSGKKSNLAVVSEPFSGRTSLFDEVVRIRPQDTTLLTLSAITSDKEFLGTLERSNDIVLVDNCHLLYMRKMGGFDILRHFLDFVVSSEKMFVTSWNIYSWNYLRQIFQLERVFSRRFDLPKFSTDDLKKLITSQYGGEIAFVEGSAPPQTKVWQLSKKTISIKPLERSFDAPILRLNFDEMRSRIERRLWLKEDRPMVSAEKRIFELLKDISQGNPGVAKAIWEARVLNKEVEPADMVKPKFNIGLNYDEAFVLYTILSMESITKDELIEIAAKDIDIDQLLYVLSQQGLISRQGDLCKILPEALHDIENYMKSLRLVW